ncbi:hypothetical protein LWP59_03590 [Amycolatopsis acidiphila]|uniref:Uncharacterized protein n=1 Tax=Amycolatopsis acidiphila TaxID=715473 RepID=A0A557ZYI0_9PSEU|nr:hypothetical protein [Amycolatopsis acidiphila]TVT17060.1 hypothetical protein FNH06_32935 [Amycolatopsis acidiphila]UIJ60779.1 hypothetical protein LWP59_03590 [Amycolatopsis acidiphila]
MVPPRPAAGRHSSFAPGPLDPPARGSLPLISQILEEGTPAFPAARGELPVPPSAPAPRAKPPRRTKVKLTPPTCHDENGEDDDVRVYIAPPETGLGSFDLGSVPASVTPPRTWRKAAWFATASSGGVVVALLFAGSALVGKPAPDQAGDAWIPGLGGGLPTVEGERVVPGPAGRSSDTVTSGRHAAPDPSTSSDPSRRPDSLRAPDGTTTEGTAGTTIVPTDSTGSGPSSAPTPTTTPIPAKPQPTPAPYDADPWRFQFAEADPQTLAKDSQTFLDSVTEDPQAAYAMTTGELQQEGTQGLERKYADVAYFQVEHVQVHQYDGKTVCTVKLVRKNGSASTEQRTLTFQRGKIASDGS